METVYDWASMIIFAGVVVLFLQRSMEAVPADRYHHYLLASGGCVLGNYLGNHGMGALATVTIAVDLIYILLVLKPFRGPA